MTGITIDGDDYHRCRVPFSFIVAPWVGATAPGSGRTHDDFKRQWAASQVRERRKPRLIFWELTKGCNLRCIHCRASATEFSSPSDLSTQAARDIIDQIAEVSSPILVLSGGEPLFRSDIFQLAQYGTDKGLRVALATNGTLVTKQVAQKIVDSGVKRVAISLDGVDAATHDMFRGIPGRLMPLLRASATSKISACRCRSIPRSRVTMRTNFRMCLAMARSLGADALHTFLLVPVGAEWISLPSGGYGSPGRV